MRWLSRWKNVNGFCVLRFAHRSKFDSARWWGTFDGEKQWTSSHSSQINSLWRMSRFACFPSVWSKRLKWYGFFRQARSYRQAVDVETVSEIDNYRWKKASANQTNRNNRHWTNYRQFELVRWINRFEHSHASTRDGVSESNMQIEQEFRFSELQITRRPNERRRVKHWPIKMHNKSSPIVKSFSRKTHRIDRIQRITKQIIDRILGLELSFVS